LKVAVVGLWHLGTVTAACTAAAGHDVTAIDDNIDVINDLNRGIVPVAEPGLSELVKQGSETRRLRFASEIAEVRGHDVVWITYDTPVREDDSADVEYVAEQIRRVVTHVSPGSVLLVSSQMPVGSIRRLEQWHQESGSENEIHFACSPENLRLGKAIDVFTRPDRVIIGTRSQTARGVLADLWRPITEDIVWMSVESAEMTKHALNGFLATSITFMNELALICEREGADGSEVEQGLKTDVRIGPRAYLHAGSAFAGGTLARDIQFLTQTAKKYDITVPVIGSVKESNDRHKDWTKQKLKAELGEVLRGKTVAVLGLTYKPGTNTLRRSLAVELSLWLSKQGADVEAFDPAIDSLPEELDQFIDLRESSDEALKGADAAILATEWPIFREISRDVLMKNMKQPLVIDANRFLEETIGRGSGIRYFAVGRSSESER
jgi:UDPglucose 6-dehydrogenase